MHNRDALIFAATVVALAAMPGCDRKPSGQSGPPALMAVSASPSESPVPTAASVRAIAALPAGRATTLAAMPGGSIFVLQTASDGEGGTISELRDGANTPQTTGLSTELVLHALGINKNSATDASSAGNGRFTAIAPCADGRLAFSFAGVSGSRPIAAVGTFDPKSQQIFISADFIALAGIDPELATDVGRPSLFTAGDDAWLWRTAGSEVRLLSVEGLSEPRPKLSKQSVSLEQVKDVLARSAWEWSATPTRGEFLLTDTASRWIRRVDAKGAIAHVARFDETITTISPAALDGAGRILVMGNDRDGIAICALVQDADAFKAIARPQFELAGLDANTPLRLDRLYAVPGERNAFIGYEATSGNVVSVKFK